MTHLPRISLVALLAAFAGTACGSSVDTPPTIRACLVVPHDTCVGPATSTSADTLTSGLLDAAYRARYTCLALVENQGAEAPQVLFDTAEVQVLTVDPAKPTAGYTKLLAHYTVPVTGTLDPGTGAAPGLVEVSVTAIDTITAAGLYADAKQSGARMTVVSSIILQGKTSAGEAISTGELRFPIDVCAGCLCTEPTADTCDTPMSTPPPDCMLGQDQPFDCRLTAAACQH